MGMIDKPEECRVVKRKVMLSESDKMFISAIEDAGSISPIATLLHKISLERNDRTLSFHTKEFDVKKKVCGHIVGMLFPLRDFKPYQEVSSLENVKFGRINNIIEANVNGSAKTFFKVELMKTQEYRFGGYWFVKDETIPTTIIVRPSQVSEPLITCDEGDRIAVLNSKLTFPNQEAGIILEHEGVLD